MADILDRGRLLALLNDRFDKIDFKLAARDVLPFVTDIQAVDLWSEHLFYETAKRLLVD